MMRGDKFDIGVRCISSWLVVTVVNQVKSSQVKSSHNWVNMYVCMYVCIDVDVIALSTWISVYRYSSSYLLDHIMYR